LWVPPLGASLRGHGVDGARIDLVVVLVELGNELVELLREVLGPQLLRHPSMRIARDDDHTVFHDVLPLAIAGRRAGIPTTEWPDDSRSASDRSEARRSGRTNTGLSERPGDLLGLPRRCRGAEPPRPTRSEEFEHGEARGKGRLDH